MRNLGEPMSRKLTMMLIVAMIAVAGALLPWGDFLRYLSVAVAVGLLLVVFFRRFSGIRRGSGATLTTEEKIERIREQRKARIKRP